MWWVQSRLEFKASTTGRSYHEDNSDFISIHLLQGSVLLINITIRPTGSELTPLQMHSLHVDIYNFMENL